MKLVAVIALVVGLSATATAATKPWLWTTKQASSALMRQAEDFVVEQEQSRDLVAARCRGVGKAVQRRYSRFLCTATAQRGAGDPLLNIRVNAKTRRAGGICWAAAPNPIPSGCFAPGVRGEGSPRDAWAAMYRTVDNRYVQGGDCLPHGAGFFTCSWSDAAGPHRGTVVFRPQPVAKVLS